MTRELPAPPDPERSLRVSEVFGPTIQGEGPAAGRAAWFVRLMGCNLSCTWCDTPFTWDAGRFDLAAQTTLMTPEDIAGRLGQGIAVLSGGEPLLQQITPGWSRLCQLLAGHPLHIETNGTIAPNETTRHWVDTFVVSPKLPNAGEHRGRQNPALHPAWADVPNAHLKFVCKDYHDVQRAAEVARDAGFFPTRTWVMPEGTTTDQLAGRWKTIAEAAAELGINASHRLHTLAWGEERGH